VFEFLSKVMKGFRPGMNCRVTSLFSGSLKAGILNSKVSSSSLILKTYFLIFETKKGGKFLGFSKLMISSLLHF